MFQLPSKSKKLYLLGLMVILYALDWTVELQLLNNIPVSETHAIVFVYTAFTVGVAGTAAAIYTLISKEEKNILFELVIIIMGILLIFENLFWVFFWTTGFIVGFPSV